MDETKKPEAAHPDGLGGVDNVKISKMRFAMTMALAADNVEQLVSMDEQIRDLGVTGEQFAARNGVGESLLTSAVACTGVRCLSWLLDQKHCPLFRDGPHAPLAAEMLRVCMAGPYFSSTQAVLRELPPRLSEEERGWWGQALRQTAVALAREGVQAPQIDWLLDALTLDAALEAHAALAPQARGLAPRLEALAESIALRAAVEKAAGGKKTAKSHPEANSPPEAKTPRRL